MVGGLCAASRRSGGNCAARRCEVCFGVFILFISVFLCCQFLAICAPMEKNRRCDEWQFHIFVNTLLLIIRFSFPTDCAYRNDAQDTRTMGTEEMNNTVTQQGTCRKANVTLIETDLGIQMMYIHMY